MNAVLIEVERLRAQYRNMPIALLGSLVASVTTGSMFVGTLPGARIGIWIALIALAVALRWQFVYRPFRRGDARALDPGRASKRFILGALMAGFAWGSAGFFLFAPQNVALQAWLGGWLIGMGVSSVPAYAADRRVYTAYLLPSVVPTTGYMLHEASTFSLGMAFGLVLFSAVMLLFAKLYNGVLVDSWRLRFENLELIDKLQQQKSAAEAASLSKSRFLAAASHDLRQPMHALSFYIAALSHKPLPPDALQLTENLQRCAGTMDELFSALLDISRLDAGIVTPTMTTFALDEIFERVRIEFEPRARQQGLQLRVRAGHLLVRTDARMLLRVVSNLVANSVQHAQRGKILLAGRARGSSVQVCVYDTGVGIATDKHRLIFEEFYQIGNPERDRTKGLGLGLAVVDRLVKLLGLSLTLRSDVGRGSLFCVTVPRGHRDEVAQARSEPLTLADLAGALIVVIDDEAEVRNATRALLESWRAEVISAESGAEAIGQLANAARSPDVLICDYRLRDNENALTVVETIRNEFNRDIPALLITGDTAPERLQEAVASGLELLHKPVAADELRAALGRALTNSLQDRS